ncbi:MAG TPA: hypothetical protein VNB64_13165, partial [Solirubrobacteraceae bacterium]|nr:hypothetical protein [Solirubrobacteraceae bacterium]
MAAVVHHALLGAAVAALFGAGSRVAARATAVPLERAVSAVVLAAAAAVTQALALGLVGLGTDPIALGLAAGATWVLARWRLPEPPGRGLSTAALERWRELGPAERAALGAAAGALGAWGVWALHRPAIGLDGVVYHLTEIVGWVHSGRPGEIQRITYEYPVGNYPVTNEVLLAWATGLARSFVPGALSTLAALGLALTAGWMGLRALGVARVAAALALAAVVTLPLTVQQLGGPNTDLPALAWLVTAGALCACAARRPALLAVALVAAALAVGTKTT